MPPAAHGRAGLLRWQGQHATIGAAVGFQNHTLPYNMPGHVFV